MCRWPCRRMTTDASPALATQDDARLCMRRRCISLAIFRGDMGWFHAESHSLGAWEIS